MRKNSTHLYRTLTFLALGSLLGVAAFFGCRGTQARVMHNGEASKVGSNQAGAEVYTPMVKHGLDKLFARTAAQPVRMVAYDNGMVAPARRKVCFIGLENRSMEELGDFRDHIKMAIQRGISQAEQFEIVSDRAVEAGMRELRLRPDDLFIPENRRMFTEVMSQGTDPVDYLLFATLTSGTTVDNKDMQRDYELTFELIDTRSFTPIIESMPIRKEYSNSAKGKLSTWWKK